MRIHHYHHLHHLSPSNPKPQTLIQSSSPAVLPVVCCCDVFCNIWRLNLELQPPLLAGVVDGQCVVPAVSNGADTWHEGRCAEVWIAGHRCQHRQCASSHHDCGGAHVGDRFGGDRDQLVGAQWRVPCAPAGAHPAYQRPGDGDAAFSRLWCLRWWRQVLYLSPSV